MTTRIESTTRVSSKNRYGITDDAEHNFFAPLTTHLNPVVGLGGATFARTTTAWGFDSDGVLYEVPSGAARFIGARCIYNMIQQSENLSTAWSRRGSCTVTGGQTDPLGKSTAYQINALGLSSVDDFYNSAPTTLAIDTPLSLSFWINRVSTSGTLRIGHSWGLAYGQANIDLSALPDGWNYIHDESPYVTFTTSFSVSKTNGTGVWFFAPSGGPLDVKIWGVQLAVSTQVNKKSPEYVSRGVLSGLYHGAGADGVKYFSTNNGGGEIDKETLSGYLVERSRSNNLIFSRDLNTTIQNSANVWTSPAKTGAIELVTNGTFNTDTTGWTPASGASLSVVSGAMRVTTSGAQYSSASQAVTVTPGKTYILSFNYTAGTVAGYVAVGTATGTSNVYGVVINPPSGQYTAIFTPLVSTIYINTYTANTGTNGQYYDIDSISLKETTVSVNKSGPGLDGVANSCTLITADESNATLTQGFTMASSPRTFSAYIKRKKGYGKIYITRDNGGNWKDVTGEINTEKFTRVYINNDSVTDPVCGFKIETVGDAILVDCCQDEAGANYSSPIITTTSTVTRNSDVLSFSSSNLSATKNTCYHEAKQSDNTRFDRRSICYTASTNDRAQWMDDSGGPIQNAGSYGTGSGILFTGVAGVSDGIMNKCVMRWENGATGSGFFNGVKLVDTAGTVNVIPTTIDIGGVGPGAHFFGTVKNVRIWDGRVLTDDQCVDLTKYGGL